MVLHVTQRVDDLRRDPEGVRIYKFKCKLGSEVCEHERHLSFILDH